MAIVCDRCSKFNSAVNPDMAEVLLGFCLERERPRQLAIFRQPIPCASQPPESCPDFSPRTDHEH